LAQLIGGVAEDCGDTASFLIREYECRSLNAIAALPTDREGCAGFQDADWFGLPLSSQPYREAIGGVEKPGITGFGGEQDQLANRYDAAIMVGCPTLNIAHLIGKTKILALHDPVVRSTRNGFAAPSRLRTD
jgi:hypothetical protein